jgi:hypothetical protein
MENVESIQTQSWMNAARWKVIEGQLYLRDNFVWYPWGSLLLLW